MARTKATTEEVIARLEPWLTTLRRLHPPGHDEVPAFHRDDVGPRVVWIGGSHFFDPSSKMESLDVFCEALSLLMLLARVDIEVWKGVVLKIWESETRLWRWIERSLPEKFEVGLDLFQISEFWLDMDPQLNDHTRRPSADYSKLREYLMSMLEADADAEDNSHLSVRVRIELDMSGESCDHTAEWLGHTLSILKEDMKKRAVRDPRSRTRGSRIKRPLLKITDVAFMTTVDVKIELEGLKDLAEFANLGVRLSHLPPLQIELEPHENGIVVQALRDISRLDTGVDTEKPGTRTISINDAYSPDLLEHVLTTAQHSSMVRSIEIDIGNGEEPMFEDQIEQWKATAYAIFSRHANHNAHTLELNVLNLLDIEVHAVRRVLMAEDTFEGTGRTSNQFTESTPRQLVASRFTLEVDKRDSDSPFETKKPLAVRVLDPPDEDTMWTVLLPGHDEAYVRDEDVLSKSEEELHLINRQDSPVPTFRRIDILRMSDDSMEPVADLLELIAKETRRIDLHENVGDLAVDEWCASVFAACPKLEELQLRHACVLNLGIFVKAAEEGHCRLRELLALIVPTGESSDHLRTFFNTLSDAAHPLTINLLDLELRLAVETEDPATLIEPVL